MTDEAYEEWRDFIHESLEVIAGLQMNIYPVYIETKSLYSYDVGKGVSVYDIPIDGMDYDNADMLFKLHGDGKDTEDSNNFALFLRAPSDASEGKPSVIIPKDTTVIGSLGEITAVLFDNNVNHIGNPFIIPILSSFCDAIVGKYKELCDTPG